MVNHARAKELFLGAIAHPTDERTYFLADACGGDVQLRHRVEELLDAHEAAGRFLNGASRSSAHGTDSTPDAKPTEGARGHVETAGVLVGRYKLLQLIGEGGFGSVFMAEQTEPVVRRVALKIIKAGMDTKQVIARFEAERQALAMMDHPNIARVLDAGATESGRPYFVMELVRGDAVTQFCDRERLSIPKRLELFRDVCNAVQHAHQKGIIHRDLKPSNVLVTVADGEPLPKVIDFGIAKATAGRLTDKTLFTEHRALIGTPAYMSPEQAEMSGVDIDTRSDIYALGVLLYELLTGSTPFDPHRLRSAPFVEVQRIIREEEPPRPSLRLRTVAASSALARLRTPARPAGDAADSSAIDIARCRCSEPMVLVRALRGDLDWIGMKCLEKDRRRRYATASELAEDVGRYLDHQPVLASPPSTGYRLRKFVRRNRAATVAGVVVASALVIAAGVSVAFGLSEARQRRNAEAARSELEQVAKFQEAQLSGIDAQIMGARLRADLLDEARSAAEQANLSAEEVGARVAELEELVAGSDFTGMALEALEENFFQPALAGIEQQFSDQPLVQARLLHTSAFTMLKLGLLNTASEPQEQALVIRRRELGDEHRDTIASINNMGLLLQAQGKLDAAEPYFLDALEKYRRTLGESHPNTLTVLNNLGLLLEAQGKLADAEQYHREALDERRRVLGDDHPDVLASIGHMCNLLRAQGRFADAEQYCREAVDQSRQIRGDDHRDTFAAINNLGALLEAQGRLVEAEQCWRETLDGFHRLLGDDHPDTITVIHNLAFVIQSQGRLAEAVPFCREALARSRRVLGDDHPQTLNAINSIARLLYVQGNQEEAAPYLREALATSRRVLGDEHPETLTTMTNLATLLYARGELAEAEGNFREVLDKRRRVLGDEHPATLTLINNVGGVLQAQGRLDEAEPYYREALEIQRRLLGDEHSNTVLSISNLGSLLLAQDNLAEAEPYCREALDTRRRTLGDENPQTLISINIMARLLRAQGKPVEAIELLAAAEPAARRAFTGDNALRLGRFLTALGRARADIAEFDEAEGDLNEAHAVISEAKGATPRDHSDVLTGLVNLYDAWHAVEPDGGHDAQAEEWRQQLSLVTPQAAQP